MNTGSFQIYDWLAKDIENEFNVDISDVSEDDEDSGMKQKYVAYIFAKSKQKNNVCIKVNGYTPFFWIELPDTWKKSWTLPLFEQLKDRLPKNMKNEIVDNIDRAVRLKYKFRDYQWNKPKKFMQLVFKSETALRHVYYALKKPFTFLPANLRKHHFPIYEKNIAPILRLIHLRKLKPTGFVRLEKAKQVKQLLADTEFELNYEVFWKDLHPVEEDSIGALKIASFDIECDSSHGDFPIAIKDYNKLEQNIGDEYRRIKSKNSAVTPSLIKQWIECAFREYSKKEFDVSLKSSIQTIFLKEKVVVAALRDGRLPAVASRDTEYKFITNKRLDTISFKIHTELMKNNKSKETVSKIVAILNEFLPKVEGDKVIQIGTVMYEYGNEKSSIKRHIITLRGCDPISGCEVVACDTVKQVFVEWCKMMRREQPNILTGYNINGFDFKFMWDCAKEYDCLHLLKNLGPLKNQECTLVEKELFSAALGHNFLYYFDMPGIVVVDLLKVIQKDHNLTSYKLDSVSNDFIFGSVTEIEHLENNDVKLTTPTTFSLEVGNYIVLYNKTIVGNEFIGNEKGEKRNIIHIDENNSVTVEGIENDSLLRCSKTKLFWSVGKDDVSPQDIFEKQNGTDADRALVAKYCVQDCELCLNLMQKLEIVANNIGMSNVCLVPFSFLFLRGQMIKTLSLVSSECLKESYLLPELPRPKEDVKDSYEGAIVLDPTPGIYLDDPVAVLDYSSLYPSSMIGSNISHDTLITEKIYQGDSGAELLRKRGIEFEDVSFDNYYMKLEGKTWKKHIFDAEPVKTCRYLQPPKKDDGEINDAKRGILPRILMKLLKARKDTRKLIKTEKDPFRCAVLDGLQLAYKVTANSLYGGVGAAVSALYYKEIAASTTAVGRNHLYLARDFCKETYPQCEIVYGDSVTSYTPVTIKHNNEILFEKIENIAFRFGNNNWIQCREDGKQEKESCELNDVETWTSKGWTKLHRIIRHTLSSNKKILRVLTHMGCVDVTDDHSLIRKNGEEVSPSDVQIGDELLHRDIDDVLNLRPNHTHDPMIRLSYDYYVNRGNVSIHCNGDTMELRYYKTKNPNAIKKIHKIDYTGYVYDLTTENHEFQAGVGNIIVHNTDSVFVNFKPTDESGKKLIGTEALEKTIEMAVNVEKKIQPLLAKPHCLEYEKTFTPFIQLSKKRYCGNKYETDVNKFKFTSMGIVLKRRDNAPIVKYIYEGIIKRIMNDRDIDAAIKFTFEIIDKILKGDFPIQYFIITKKLNSSYANPTSIVHKVLADRMGERDPGNKPQSNDRIPFAYVKTKTVPKLQGDRVEHPDYIEAKNLKLDYLFYITNQISKPVSQLFGLALENLRPYGYRLSNEHFEKLERMYCKENMCESDIREKIMIIKQKEAYDVIFCKRVKIEEGRRFGQSSITSFFKR